MEQLSYQANAFEGIVPVLDVGDPTPSLVESYKYQQEDMGSILTRMKSDAAIEQRNIKRQNEEFQDLMKFSQTAVKKYGEIKRQETKKKAVEDWIAGFNNADSPEEIKLAEEYQNTVNEQEKTESAIDNTLTKNLQNLEKDGKLTAQASADAGKIRKRTGMSAVIYANGQAEGAMEYYKPAFESYLRRTNEVRRERGLPMIEPGAHYEELKDDFNSKWASKTGMDMANPGYTAKHVYPRLRRDAGSVYETYTRQFNRQNSAEQTDKNLIELGNQTIDLTEFANRQKGLTGPDGKSLQTIDEVYSHIARAKFPVNTLQKIAAGTNPATKQPWLKHPRIQGLLSDARARRNAEHGVRRAEMNRLSMSEYDGVGSAAEAREIYMRQRETMDDDIAYNNYSRALQRTDRKLQIQRDREYVQGLLTANPNQKLTANQLKDMDITIWQEFSQYIAPNANAELTQTLIRDSDEFKALKQQLPKRLVQATNGAAKLGDIITGEGGPANSQMMVLEASNDIALRAQALMLGQVDGKDVDMATAIKMAEQEYLQEAAAKHGRGEFYDPLRNEYKQSLPSLTSGATQAALEISKLKNANTNNLPQVFKPSDYLAPTGGGREPERLRMLSRYTGITIDELRRMAREQNGMPPLTPTPQAIAFSQMNPRQRAVMASLGDFGPASNLALYQISNDEYLTGDSQARMNGINGTLAKVFGVTRFWQNRYWGDGKGFVKGGGQRVWQRPYHSKHNDPEPGTVDKEEGTDIMLATNGRQLLDRSYAFLDKNRERFGICELYWDPDGTRGHPAGHGLGPQGHLHYATCDH